jgi:hypothetical protein
MSCTQPALGERLVELLGTDQGPAELRTHVEHCQACGTELRALEETWTAMGALEPAPPSPEVLSRVHAAVATAVAPRPSVALRVGIGLLLAVAGLAFLPLQRHLAGQWGALLATPLLAVGYYFGARAASDGRLDDWRFWGTMLTGLALAFGVPFGVKGGNLSCLTNTLLVAIGPAALAWSAARRGPAGAGAGAIAGTAGALVGTLVVRLHCPGGSAHHLLLHHLPAIPLLAAAGALASLVRRPAAQI